LKETLAGRGQYGSDPDAIREPMDRALDASTMELYRSGLDLDEAEALAKSNFSPKDVEQISLKLDERRQADGDTLQAFLDSALEGGAKWDEAIGQREELMPEDDPLSGEEIAVLRAFYRPRFRLNEG